MTEKVVLSGCVQRGKLKVRGWTPTLGLGDGEVTVTIAKRRATRSLAQNAFYWSVVLKALADHTGYTVDEMHELCKQRFNAATLVLTDPDGVVVDEIRVAQSTTGLTGLEFSEFLDQVRVWAETELGVLLPLAESPIPVPADVA